MSCDTSRICRHCSMFACGEATDPSEMCREAILERLATAEAASRPVFSRRLLEHRLAAAEARAEKAISDTVQEFGLRRAAEARVRALEDALTTIRLMCADGYYGPYAFTYAMEAKRIAALALAPPPEAEKKGDNDGR